MNIIYYKTREAIDGEANLLAQKYYVSFTIVSCCCGETSGYIISNGEKNIQKLVLCDSCYTSAALNQRGE